MDRPDAPFRGLTSLVSVTSLLIGGLGLAGCTHGVRTSAPDPYAEVNDPFEPLNRSVYAFNDGFDEIVIGPAARTYGRVIPSFGRARIRNFADNLATPVWFFNEVLQGDWRDAEQAGGRFLVNSTVGLLGLFDVASDAGLEMRREDFGQTLATYKVPSGPYLVLPILGPTTARGLSGRVVDFFAHPLSWTEFDGEEELRSSTAVLGGLDERHRFDSALERVRGAAEPYANLRALYIQSRQTEIHEDGDPYADLPTFE